MIEDWTFGSLNRRGLTLRLSVPWSFCRWDGERHRFDWHRLFSPRRWFREIFSRWGYRFNWTYWDHASHRCYCTTGTMFDGSICIAGWGVTWFWSHYTGEIPCWCDRVFAEYDWEAGP